MQAKVALIAGGCICTGHCISIFRLPAASITLKQRLAQQVLRGSQGAICVHFWTRPVQMSGARSMP